MEANLYLLTNSLLHPTTLRWLVTKASPQLAKKTTPLRYYGEGTIHAKSYIFDQRISMIGSFNQTSQCLYTESIVVIDSILIAKALSDNIAERIGESVPSLQRVSQKLPFQEL